MRNGKSLVLIFAASLCLAACQQYTLDGGMGSSIGIKVSSKSNPGTKAGGPEATLNRVIRGENSSCVLEEYVGDYDNFAAPATKGAMITADDLNTANKTFHMEGWLGEEIITAVNADPADKENRHFLSDVITYSGSTWNMSSQNFWRNDIPTTFWSYVDPAEGPKPVFSWPGQTPLNTALKSVSFTYSLPSPGNDGNDAYNLQDFLIAYNRESRSRSNTGTNMTVRFTHPLTAVKFIVDDNSLNGNADPTHDEYVQILRVEISGVKTSGTFTATGSSTGCTVTCANQSGSASYIQGSATGSDIRQDIENGLFTSVGSEYVFFMIPQDLTDAKVKVIFRKKPINYNSDGTINSYGEWKTIEQSASLGGDGYGWEAGKYYTYKIKSNVYAGGETIALPTNPEDIEHSENVNIDPETGNISFSWAGSANESGYVAPIPVKSVKIIKMNWQQSYINNSGKGIRKVWLQDKDNPSLTTMSIASNYKTIVPDWKNYWPDGYTGEYVFNAKGNFTNKAETAYFLLNGEFSSIQIYFRYSGTTGSGSSDWVVTAPFFDVSEIIEYTVPPTE